MPLSALRWTLSLSMAVACSDPASSGPDAGSPGPDAGSPDPDAAVDPSDAGADAEAAPEGCTEPDRSCPDQHPHPGGPCDGALVCEYEEEPFFWTYRCEEGAWSAEPRCGGGCPVPPLAELCLDPFDGSVDGGEVTIGPPSFASALRPFADGEPVEPIWGAQGSAMVAYRLEVDGIDAPDCAGVTSTLTLAGSAPQEVADRVRLRCGQSLAVYVIVQDGFRLCDEASIPAELVVQVAGIGSTTAHLSIESAGCPN